MCGNELEVEENILSIHVGINWAEIREDPILRRGVILVFR